MISKSDYTSALQCKRMLWLKKNMPELADESLKSASAIAGGDEVGALARGLYGDGYVLIENDFDYERMAYETAEALAEGKVVCEACFAYGELVCLADIVRRLPSGAYELSEVKSTTKVKDHQLADVAFQAYVMTQAGFAPQTVNLVHVNPGYVRRGEIDLVELLAVEDVTRDIAFDVRTLGDKIADVRDVLARDKEPASRPEKHCNVPYPCPFQGRCWANIPEGSVFEMAGMGRVRGWSWWRKGVRSAEDVQAAMDSGAMRPNMLRSRQCAGADHADKTALRAFLDGNISWPIYHLDFETFQTAVPRWDGVKPYQQIPSQFSIHVQEEPNGPLRHIEFLAPSAGDPRRAVAEALIAAIPSDACVTAYNMSFERGRIKELAAALPDLADRLMSIHGAIVDLMVPFQKGMLYKPAMGASYSIKAVLPAFYPDDPELDYHALPTVHNGAQASAAFLELQNLEPEEESRQREGLLRYCELDTLAMVKVLDAIIAAAA